MSTDRLRQALQTGAVLLGVTFLSSGCIFVHLKGDAADRAMREIAEEHHSDSYGRRDAGYGVAPSPFGAHSSMTINLDVPADQLDETFETLSQGIVGRIENQGGEIVRFEKEGQHAGLYTYEQHGRTGKVRVKLERVEDSSGTPFRFLATCES